MTATLPGIATAMNCSTDPLVVQTVGAVDAVPARMLCTCRGPGTGYGPATPNGEPQFNHRMTRGVVGVRWR